MEKKREKWTRNDIECELEEERGENRKVYQLKNGQRMMAVSAEPLHCWNEKSGRYEEIGSGLSAGKNGLSGSRGAFRITLPDGKENPGRVKMSCGSRSMEWEYLGLRVDTDKMRPAKPLPQPRVDYLNPNPAYMKKTTSSKYGKHAVVQYGRVEDGVDFEYEVKNNGLKENIIIRACREDYTFCYRMKLRGLSPVLSENGRAVDFYANDGGERKRIFHIPAPFMTDAAGKRSEDAEYRLCETPDGGYELQLYADAAWINDPARTLPVTIDPYVEVIGQTTAPIRYQNTIGGLEGIATGFNDTITWGSHLYADISSISPSLQIVNATLVLEQLYASGNANFYWHLKSFKDEFVETPGENGQYFLLDVTNTVIAATGNCSPICGFTLSPTMYRISDDAGGCGNEDCGCQGSTTGGDANCGTGCPDSECKKPCDPCVQNQNGGIIFSGSSVTLLIFYVTRELYTDHQSLIPVSLNNGPVNGQVNLYTGELMYEQEDIRTGGAAIPFSISHYFNINNKNKTGVYGKGWNLSLEQQVEFLSGYTADASYIDEQGKKHYFVTESGVMKDTSGLNLTLVKTASGAVIRDRSGGKLTFELGKLTRIEDANGNYVAITRDGQGRISQVKDSFGRTVALYYAGGRLDMISDPAGRIVTYSYDSSGHLLSVLYPDGSTVEYTYDSSMRLSCVKQQDGTKTVYIYTSSNKVARTKKYPAGGNPETDTPEEYMNIDYRSRRSTAVSDRSGIRKVYVFDETGRAELEYEDVPTEIDGKAAAGRFQVTGTTLYQYAEKKRTFGTSIRTTDESNNMIVNGSFEGNSENPWQFVGKRVSSCESSLYDGVVSTDSADKTRAYRISGVAYINKYLKQTIPASRIKLMCGDTLIFSAWAKATSVTTSESGGPRFEIRAEVRYSDGSVETQRGRYDSSYTDWQYAAVPLRISRTKTLTSITVYLDYSRNQRACLFDNVRLVNAPSQSATYEENLSESVTIFGTTQTIKERVTVHDGLYTTVEEKNSAYNVVRRTVTDLDGKSFVSVFAYDNAHHVIRSQNERKMITEYAYNDKGMQTSVKSYYWDTFNPNIQTEELIANEYFKNETSYDSTGEFAVGVSDARSEDIKTSNSYNTVRGLLVNTTTPNGQTTSYTYDTAMDLVTGVRAVVGEATYSVVYGYQDRKLSSITHGGFAYGFTYDGMGRAKKVTIAGADYTENEYTLGETTTVTTSYAGGERMKVETDRHEQPVKRTYTDKNGVETVIAEGEYDSLGKPVKVLDKITQKTYTYTYDGYENVTAEKVNGAAYKEYEYDEQNRLMSTTFHVEDETQTYRPIYDTRKSDGAVYADNAVVGVTLEGVFTSKAEQDDWGRVTEKKLTITGATTPLLSEEYGYLDVSVGFETRLTTMVQLLTRKVNGVTKDTLRYTYDNNGNITAIRNGAGTEYYAKYTYDGLNQLTREDNAVLGKSWVFAYDTAGNILSKREYAYTTGTLGAVLDTKTYTYAATGWKDRLTSFNGEAIAYDALGNPTTYRGHALTWGKIRQLESYRIDSGTLLTFEYDAKNNRIRKNSTIYEYEGNKLLKESNTNCTIFYYYDNEGVIGCKINSDSYYYEKNKQGDITAIYDTDGNLKAEYVYDAWGNHTITVNIDGIATLNPFRYRGYYYDTETNLYYLKNRYYDSQIGRFISADNIIDTRYILGYNSFTYCGNSPVMCVDVTGCRRKPAVKNGSKQRNNSAAIDKALSWIDKRVADVKAWGKKTGAWIENNLKTDNGYALYDSRRNGRRGPFREQILAFTPSGPSFDLKEGNIGLGSLSVDAATGGWEYENLDLSLLDIGHAEIAAEFKNGELSVGAFISAWSPSVSFNIGKVNITLSFELLSFGGDLNVSKKSFEAKGAWGLGLGLSVNW